MTHLVIRYGFFVGCYVIPFNAAVPYLTGFGSVREFWFGP